MLNQGGSGGEHNAPMNGLAKPIQLPTLWTVRGPLKSLPPCRRNPQGVLKASRCRRTLISRYGAAILARADRRWSLGEDRVEARGLRRHVVTEAAAAASLPRSLVQISSASPAGETADRLTASQRVSAQAGVHSTPPVTLSQNEAPLREPRARSLSCSCSP